MTAATFKLVPVEPTEEMLHAPDVYVGGYYSCSASLVSGSECAEIYAAMLAAAPAAGGLSFDAAWDGIDWDTWRMQPISDLVRHLHALTATTAPVAAPAPSAKRVDCADCKGTGLADKGDCEVCNGAGSRIAAPAPSDELAKAKRALLRAGFVDLGGAEWKPPVGKPPVFIEAATVPSDARMQRFILMQCIHNMVVANQAAWIEWQHGNGAEAAMQWVQNGLAGPGHIPDAAGMDAQAYFNANVDERMEPTPAAPQVPA